MGIKIKLGKPGGPRLRDKRKRSVTRRAGRGRRGGQSVSPRYIGVVFCNIFLLLGLIGTYFFFGKPVLGYLDARDWPAAACAITASDVEVVSGDDGNTYRVDIRYTYTFDGQAYDSDRYSFFNAIATSARPSKQAVVDRHAVGSTATCYVNPAKPSKAVIHRGLSHVLWFALVPLVFAFIGGGGLLSIFWSGSRKAWATRHATRADNDDDTAGQEDWLPELAHRKDRDAAVAERSHHDRETVRPTKSRWTTLLTVTGIALFWNGIVSVFVVQIFNGNASWFGGLFMIPFVLVGLGLLLAIVYQLLALSNPVAELTFEPRVVAVGRPMKLSWTLSGKAERIQKLTVTVEGLERATYTRGTDTITDEHKFFEHTLYEAESLGSRNPMAREHEVTMDIPADTMHSFDAPNNKIVWRVKVHGDIPRWPDVKDDYEFAVVPGADEHPARGMF